MPLEPRETTPVTEAIEEGTKHVVEVLEDVSRHAERLVSDWTRDGGAHATVQNHATNVARLNVACLMGSATLWSTLADNLALIAADVPHRWMTDQLTFSTGPKAGQRWRLEVQTPLTNEDGNPITPAHVAPVIWDANGDRIDQVDSSWNRQFHILMRMQAFVPGLVSARVVARDVSTIPLPPLVEVVVANFTVAESHLWQ